MDFAAPILFYLNAPGLCIVSGCPECCMESHMSCCAEGVFAPSCRRSLGLGGPHIVMLEVIGEELVASLDWRIIFY